MSVATSFPALVDLAQTEQAATHVTFSSHRAGVLWRRTGGQLSAMSAFYQDCETLLWVMTDWIANTTGLDRPGDGFIIAIQPLLAEALCQDRFRAVALFGKRGGDPSEPLLVLPAIGPFSWPRGWGYLATIHSPRPEREHLARLLQASQNEESS